MIQKLMQILRERNQKKTIQEALKYCEVGHGNLFENGFSLASYSQLEQRTYLKVGSHNAISSSFVFEHPTGEVVIGDNCYIGPSKFICSTKIEIGSHVTISWGCWFYDSDSHSLDAQLRRQDQQQYLDNVRSGKRVVEDKNWDSVNKKPIKICDDAWIGMNAIILKGVTIGQGAVVGAGSVVRGDVEPWTVVAGNPAVVVKRLK